MSITLMFLSCPQFPLVIYLVMLFILHRWFNVLDKTTSMPHQSNTGVERSNGISEVRKHALIESSTLFTLSITSRVEVCDCEGCLSSLD